MNNIRQSERRPARVRVASWPHFATSLLLLFSFVSSVVRAQTGAPQTGGEQDKRGIVVKPGSPQQATTPEEQKARGARPELVLQTGYAFPGMVRMQFSPDGRLLATLLAFMDSQVKLWDVATGRELRTLVGSTGAGFLGGGQGFTSIAFSRDGRQIAAGGYDGSIKVWDVETGRGLRAMGGGGGDGATSMPIFTMAFAPDNRTLITVGIGVNFWDVSTGQQLRSPDMEAGFVADFASTLTFTPDGSQLLLISPDKDSGDESLTFFEVATGREVRRTKIPDELQHSNSTLLAYAPGGHLLAAAEVYKRSGDRHQFKLWDLTAGGGSRSLAEVPEGKKAQLSFSPDGRLVSLIVDNKVRVWDAATGGEARSLDVPDNPAQNLIDAPYASTAFSPNGRQLATSGNDSKIYLWDTGAWRIVRLMAGHTNLAFDASFSPDGTRLYTGGKTIWDVATGRGLRASSAQPDAKLGTVSPDGRQLALWSMRESRVELYDLATQRRQTLAPAGKAGTYSASFSPDGRLLATTYMLNVEQVQAKIEAKPKIDNEAMAKASKDMMKAMQKDPASAMKVYSDMLAKQSGAADVSGIENQVKIWDTATGREVQSIVVPPKNALVPSQGIFSRPVFSTDGRTVAVVPNDSPTVTLWDVSTGQQVRTFGGQPAPSAPAGMPGMPTMPGGASIQGMLGSMGGAFGGGGEEISNVAFSADGRLMATGGKNVQSGLDMGALMSAAMASGAKRAKGAPTPDPQKMAMDMMSQTKVSGPIKLWDVASGRELLRIEGHKSQVNAVAVSSDARLLASAASDNTIKLWDASNGRELHNLAGQNSNVNSLGFSPDGKLLASSSMDGSTFLWDVKTGERLATLISVGDGGDWLVVTPDGLFDGSPAAWNEILWRFTPSTFDVEPVETFFNEFFYPGLLSDIASGKRPKAPRDISLIDRRQPVVGLNVSATANAPVSTRTINVSVQVKDAPAGAKDVRLFRNGSLVKVWHGDVLKGQPSATLEASIPVVAGENRLTAYAFNRDNVKSADAEARVTGADALKRAGTAYVLAVGVNSYANAQYNLKYAVADAEGFADEVRKQQTQVGKYERVEVVSLLDAEATKANILAALKLLAGSADAPPASAPKSLAQFKQAQPEDMVVVYFAGHGTAHGNRFYLIPHDLGYAGGRDALDEAGLKSMLAHSVSDEELQSAVESLDAAQLLLVIDACNSGQALEAEEKRRGPMNSKGLAQLAYEKGMYILTAAQSYQAALEAAHLGHGLLTYALVEEGLKAMAADGEPRDGVLQAREWLDFAADRVPQMQMEKMKQARALNVNIAFANGEDATADPERRSVQRPRAFYRRELESSPLILARKQ
ncbi:MAG: caspase family protein [Rubrivivax sp.]|nr:caspase family protein [Pyrinomonadaceae bacterium]